MSNYNFGDGDQTARYARIAAQMETKLVIEVGQAGPHGETLVYAGYVTEEDKEWAFGFERASEGEDYNILAGELETRFQEMERIARDVFGTGSLYEVADQLAPAYWAS